MDIGAVVEMLKNNRTLWVTATVTGGFGVVISVMNAIWLFIQRRKQLDYDKKLEIHKSGLGKELEEFKNGLGKELDRFRNDLEKKKYVSKVRFDTEFALFRDLWGACRKMVNDVYFVYPTFANVPADEEARKKYEQKVYEAADSSYRAFCELLDNNAPFISAEIYAKFEEIGLLCRQNLNLYEEKWNRGVLFVWEGSSEQREAKREAYKRTKEFNKKYSSLINELRCYLDKLDVGEKDGNSNE